MSARTDASLVAHCLTGTDLSWLLNLHVIPQDTFKPIGSRAIVWGLILWAGWMKEDFCGTRSLSPGLRERMCRGTSLSWDARDALKSMGHNCPKLAESFSEQNVLCQFSLCVWRNHTNSLEWEFGCGRLSCGKEALLQPVPPPAHLTADTPRGHL